MKLACSGRNPRGRKGHRVRHAGSRTAAKVFYLIAWSVHRTLLQQHAEVSMYSPKNRLPGSGCESYDSACPAAREHRLALRSTLFVHRDRRR